MYNQKSTQHCHTTLSAHKYKTKSRKKKNIKSVQKITHKIKNNHKQSHETIERNGMLTILQQTQKYRNIHNIPFKWIC